MRSAGNLLRYPITGHAGLLRAGGERPRRRRAANEGDEFALVHSITSDRFVRSLLCTSGRSDFFLALIVGFGLRPSRRGPGADDGGKLIVRHCIQLGVQLRLH